MRQNLAVAVKENKEIIRQAIPGKVQNPCYHQPPGKVDPPIGSFFASIGKVNASFSNFSASIGKVNPSPGNFSASIGKVDPSFGNFSVPIGKVDPSPADLPLLVRDCIPFLLNLQVKNHALESHASGMREDFLITREGCSGLQRGICISELGVLSINLNCNSIAIGSGVRVRF